VGFSLSYRLLALALLFALPGAAHAELKVAPLPPSPALAEAMAAERFDEAMTLARREHEACMAANDFAACIGLLAAESDALTAWTEDHGDFDRDDKGEGLALRTARRLHDEVGKLEGWDGRIFGSAFGNLGEMLTLYGRPVEGEQDLRDALRYNIVRTMEIEGVERVTDRAMQQALLRLTRNLALQGNYADAAGFLQAADSLISTMRLIAAPEANRATVDYVAVAALVPETGAVYRDYMPASVLYDSELEHQGEFWDPGEWQRYRDRLARGRIALFAQNGETAKAVALYDAAPDLLRGARGAAGAEFRFRLGAALVAEGRSEDGRAMLVEAMPVVENLWAPTDDRRIDAHVAYGTALESDPAASAAQYEQAVAGAVP
jgi:hypothetical protein